MMTTDIAGDIIAMGLHLVLMISIVAIVPSLLIGLLVSIFQATTQINEQTLSFLPRLVMTMLVLIFAGKWMMIKLSDFTVSIFQQAAQLVG
ncbi:MULTISPECIES: flagellar biosynthesis protein FliQ [Yersinia pseudotuberculosis complex]|uniref:Flagellar biosynthetic protein FliQ n=10 Tax=Yersinia pseudotuberculosis complex TaxID=1649845 RepID=A0A6B3V452_YERPE|nr:MULTISPECIES: flagellar biosynthesis protein FliQ [Yersinia pseudotuberculosis complex]EDR31613.1 flagellar biosynthetic protein FliQ [Yersinia pestis biovar Orientalis str. IP275]EFA46972.1 flagellar biosynthetic protein FliQ [Yersinia pestis KIM D27]ERP77400.1 flagellar biosynthesis protein FliQ [Yersinia pestis S3]ERP77515.1 flagellar biosynthesis protein FliQ [Yersinia pestis 24H]CQD56333.1 lateral flagellar export/assembly protein [Yersinia intermedia]